MREIDFLPEWYKESKRRRLHLRRQYVALTVIFLAMLTYNLTSEYRVAKAGAEIMQFEDQRVEAEEVMRQFNQISRALGEHKAKAEVIEQIDSRIDLGAVLAEISHLINDRVVLSRVDFISEPIARTDKKQSGGGSTVRAVSRSDNAAGQALLGDVRFRIVLAGVAVESGDTTALFSRLEESPYFTRVSMSFSRPGTINVSPGPTGQTPARARETLGVTAFEMTCYLANYEEISN